MKINKQAISAVVATALLLVVAVVTLVSYQAWYGSYQNSVLAKIEGKGYDVTTINVERVQSSGVSTKLLVRSNHNLYAMLLKAKIDDVECALLGSDVIGEKTVTELELDCATTLGSAVNIVLVTDEGLVQGEYTVR
jgi:hypothetical protein